MEVATGTAKASRGQVEGPGDRDRNGRPYRLAFRSAPPAGQPHSVWLLFLSLILLLSLSLSCMLGIRRTIMNLENQLRSDSRIERLMKNANWSVAAEAAIQFLIHGTECPIASWRKSSTWAQVEMVYKELKARGVR